MISVIVPIYNVEKYLENCINSILNQSYKDFELILVDDGSPDNCGKICDDYAKKDSRIKVIHKKNGGLSDARNVGIEAAKGEYISFIDSDDWIHKDFYLTLFNALSSSNSDIAICNFLKVSNNDIKDKIINTNPTVETLSNLEVLNDLYSDNYVNCIIACNKLYKTILFKDIKFPVGKIHEDEFTTPKVLFESNKIAIIDEPLYYYRQTPNSIMNREFNIANLSFLEAIENRLNFITEHHLNAIYDKCLYQLSFETINLYYMIKDSNISNKENLLRELSEKISSLNISALSLKSKLLINLFKFSPKLYKVIQN
ncbi:glycosyltransferase family 2 protein [Clostridium sp.]|uniref:glycosyltransferase family 2 protein n=1 Tax=Clostridium sp. TaxID=1506 RepID=UPI0039930138